MKKKIASLLSSRGYYWLKNTNIFPVNLTPMLPVWYLGTVVFGYATTCRLGLCQMQHSLCVQMAIPDNMLDLIFVVF